MIKMKNWFIYFCLFFIALSFQSCSVTDDFNNPDIGDHTYQLAVPLVNTKATVGYFAENADGNVTLGVDPSGKTTLFFNGEVLRRNTSSFFPPFPGLTGIPITDTIFSYPVPFKNNPEIKKATFRNTKINFYFEHNETENVTVTLTFKNLFKNGIPFSQKVIMPYGGMSSTRLTTDKVSVDGYQMISENNSLDIYYEAVTAGGKKIKLNRAEFYFDVIVFAYMEGYIGYHISPVSGNFININLFDKWLSGTFDFENPKISIIVENSFGFPVRSKVNSMLLTTISGNQVNLESEFIENGIDFNYPSISEIGQTKKTLFSFDRTNSNIREVFNEKTKRIDYDISAEINPEKDPSIQGFLDENSFYVVSVAAELPLQGSINDVVLTDTLAFDPSFLDGVLKAGFKMNIENTFPMDLYADIYFLDENKNRIYSLFGTESLSLPSPGLNSLGLVNPGSLVKKSVELDDNAIKNIKKSKYVTIVGKINTVDHPNNEPVWIYNNNGLLFQMGALVDYQK